MKLLAKNNIKYQENYETFELKIINDQFSIKFKELDIYKEIDHEFRKVKFLTDVNIKDKLNELCECLPNSKIFIFKESTIQQEDIQQILTLM